MPELALFWTPPRTLSTDFTPEDPLAFDYLGQQVGNWLWPGFTSRTSRAGYYPFVVYGLRLCDDIAAREGLGRDDGTIRALFERWERLWALAVCAYRDGQVPNGDVMRGLRGALRYYRGQRRGEYSLDFPLLSRQLELGGLGAYLTSLREHGLVARDRLRPTPLGAQLADWMWGAPGERIDHIEDFVRKALSPDQTTIPVKVGRVTIRTIGEHGGLGKIQHRQQLRDLLWARLFEDHPPPRHLAHLRVLAELLSEANKDGVTDAATFLRGVSSERWRAVEPALRSLVDLAITFGDLSAILRSGFDRAYQAVQNHGCTAPLAVVAEAAFPPELMDQLVLGRERWLEQDGVLPRMSRLESHGPAFVQAMRTMNVSSGAGALMDLLAYHRKVQGDRGRHGGWLRHDGDLVLLERGGYASWSLDPDRWVVTYKIDAMRQLLQDLGRLS